MLLPLQTLTLLLLLQAVALSLQRATEPAPGKDCMEASDATCLLKSLHATSLHLAAGAVWVQLACAAEAIVKDEINLAPKDVRMRRTL